MGKLAGALLAGVLLLSGCKAPEMIFSGGQPVAASSDSYESLWRACRAVLARQYDLVQENERNGTLVARGKSAAMVARPNADPADSRTVMTEIKASIVPAKGGYEARIRAITRGAPGPDFDSIRTAGMPETKEGADFNDLGTSATRDFALEEQLASQIRAELSYPAPRGR